ncbi:MULTISPECIES: PPOX class F420-dependent oxidoreductase [Streptomyces]|uniref:PPOX class F420-dependent oxidoreductase n=1 Tax=Streptomyces TaxID=1883 RepID=UPI000516B060|nr:PPOX class F420-dependent oxidoreductase [Streptomyces sp. CNS654]
MAHHMTDEEWRGFLSEGTRTAKVSTVRADGRPHIAPVWFLLDGDSVVFNTGKESVKGRNLARDGRVALCVDDDRPPYAFAVVQGQAELSEDPEELLRWATRIAVRYVGADAAEEFGRRNGVPGELVVRVRIDKVVAMAGMAD